MLDEPILMADKQDGSQLVLAAKGEQMMLHVLRNHEPNDGDEVESDADAYVFSSVPN